MRHLLDIGRTLLDTETIGAFLSGHMQDTITIGVKLEIIELSESNVFIGWTLTCIRHSTFQTLCTCQSLRLKKVFFRLTP